jgi:hypothetical protein
VQHACAEIGGGDERRVHGCGDLRLEPCLLVQADFQVREQDPRRFFGRIAKAALMLVMRERFAQVLLAVGRRTRFQGIGECRKRRRVLGAIDGNAPNEPGKLAAYFREHFQIAAGHLRACSLERIERRVNFRSDSAQRCVGLKEAFLQ